MKVYASGNKSGVYGTGTKKGQATTRANMQAAGATEQQINNALQRGRQMNGKVTRVNR